MKKLLLFAVLLGITSTDYAKSADVEDWNGLNSSDSELAILNDIEQTGAVIRKSIKQTINGNNYTINGNGVSGYISASTGADLTLKNLNVQNFLNTRFLNTSSSSLVTIENSSFKNNSSTSDGGVLYIGSNVTIKNSSFEGNSIKPGEDEEGGAIFLESNSSLNIDSSKFSQNTTYGA